MTDPLNGPAAGEGEMPRVIDIRHIEAKPVEVTASAQECLALARRFALVRIKRLSATLRLSVEGQVVSASGRLRAAIVQSCAISGEDLPVTIDEAITLRFVPEGDDASPDEEIEITEAECDEIPYEGGRIDLGEAIAQSLALSIDPYATGPDADAARKAAGLSDEAASGPFAALAALRDKK
ncbi:MAG TPA: DUF177 domain-containing protein [Novosphingobium sp.]|nr:DUF177 domain-containing protein [Novosphingobium sp.]